MKKTIRYWLIIMVLAMSLGILTGCAEKEQKVKENEKLEENIIQEESFKPEIKPLIESEARRVVKEKFELAGDIYSLSLFDYDSSVPISLKEHSDSNFFIINNFDDVTKNFTEKGKNDLINNHGLIYEYQGEYYLILGGIAEDFSDYELKDVLIEPERITATYKVDVSVGEEVIIDNKEVQFVIVLQDGNWIIDTYISPSKLNHIGG